MEYRTATIGRIIVARFDHGDNVITELEQLARKEKLRRAWFHLLGGVRRADVVTGPREPVMPPEPVWDRITDPHEVVGMGSIFWEDDQPRIHLHTVLGHHGSTVCACMRKSAEVYLIIEAYIVEITGCDASRPWFPEGGFNRLTFGAG